jgi:hypothetical protein
MGCKNAAGSFFNLTEAVHARWVNILKNMKQEDFERTYTHPEYKKVFTLKEALHMYSWHGKHHLAHIKLVQTNKVLHFLKQKTRSLRKENGFYFIYKTIFLQ